MYQGPRSVQSTSSSFVGTISQIMVGVIDRCSIVVICASYRRENPHDAVVLHPSHAGKTLDTLPENRCSQRDLVDAFLYLLTLSHV